MKPWILCMTCLLGVTATAASWQIEETLEIDQVPSWFPVGFSLLTHGEKQTVAYYNKDHDLVVAQRRLGESTWEKVVLPSRVGWDSHNYLTLAIDSGGHLHLAGNMHCVPLVYFRTRDPGALSTFERHAMTGQQEERCTYPRFLRDHQGHLIFMYRDGGSGNGRRFFNVYDEATRSWKRLLTSPIFEGEGKRNAYPHGPTRGPNGLFHLVWVWRDTPDCATNHHLSYARSRDLVNWENAAGKTVPLPFLLEQSATWVDPIPPGGGIINGGEHLGFDAQNRPVITYHKQDAQGNMQLWASRFENGAWRIRTLTDWTHPIHFAGRGAMPFIGIKLSSVKPAGPNRLTLTYRHRELGSGRLVLDETTLLPVDETPPPSSLDIPRALRKPAFAYEGIQVRRAEDQTSTPDDQVKYLLQWETLPPHHDRPREPPLPPPGTLRLVTLRRAK